MSEFISYPVTIYRHSYGYVAAMPDLGVAFFAKSEQECAERLQVEGDAAAQKLFEASLPLPAPSSSGGTHSMLVLRPWRHRTSSERRRR